MVEAEHLIVVGECQLMQLAWPAAARRRRAPAQSLKPR
jgi:hypothetical protein